MRKSVKRWDRGRGKEMENKMRIKWFGRHVVESGCEREKKKTRLRGERSTPWSADGARPTGLVGVA